MLKANWLTTYVTAAGLILIIAAPLGAAGRGSGHSPSAGGPDVKGHKTPDETPGVPLSMKKKFWTPPGLTEEELAEWHDGRPPGWSRGEKEGWKGGDMPPGLAKKGKLPPGLENKVPPGWEKWDNKKRTTWQQELGEAKERLRQKAAKLNDFSEDDLNSALISVEAAARTGVPIPDTAAVVEAAMEKGAKGRDIETTTRALAYGVGRNADFASLGIFARKKLEEGLRGDTLALAIYDEIAQRNVQPSRTGQSGSRDAQ